MAGNTESRIVPFLFIITLLLLAESYAFQVGSLLSKPSTILTFGDRRATVLKAASPSTVTVCTADLCCCQENGGGKNILDHLRSRNLPYPIDEAPCLGACGGGAMVSIDFEDGSCALVAGLDNTLSELLLLKETDVGTPSSRVHLMENAPIKIAPESESKTPTSPPAEVIGDARDRMRAEAAADEQKNSNPWLTAASYLAKKAGEKIFS